MHDRSKFRPVHAVATALLVLLVGAATLTGCTGSPAPESGPWGRRNVEVVESPGVVKIDAETARLIRLVNRYDEALELLAAGRQQEAVWCMRHIARDAELHGADLPPKMRQNLKRVERGEKPVVHGW